MNESIPGVPRQVVHSPEKYRLELPLAGPTSRILAYAIDYAVILLIQILVLTLAVVLLPIGDRLQDLAALLNEAEGDEAAMNSWAGLMLGFMVVTQLVVEWFYFVVLELTTRGRSLGKAIVKLRVVGDGGHPVRLTQSIARNLLRAVDILPGYYAVGLIAMIALDEGKRLGDLAAGTAVIRLDRPASAPAVSIDATSGEVFRFDRHQVARIGRQEERLARQTLRRLPDLPEPQVEIVLERTVEAIARRIGHEAIPAGARTDFLRAVLRVAERH